MPAKADKNSSRRTKLLTRRSLLVVLAALGAIVLFFNLPTAVEVVEAEVGPDGGLRAIVDSCGGELSVDVYEDDSLVVIEVLDQRFRIRFSGDDCLDVISIPLSVPLGNRLLMDDYTGGQLPVSVLDADE